MANAAIATNSRPLRAGAGKRRPLLLLLVLALVLGGCLSTRFIFNQVDWLMVWYLSDVFSLEKEQKKALSQVVNRNLDWVRTEQLPQYAEMLRVVDAGINDGSLSVAQLDSQFSQMLSMWDVFLRQVIPDMASFLGDLSDQQVADFVSKSEVKNEELWEEYAGETPEKRVERRLKSAIKNLQRFTGKLNDQQVALVAGHLERMYDNSAEWMQGRRQWQANFQALVLERPPRDQFIARLEAMILDPNAVDSEDYRRKVDANKTILMEMFVDLTGQLDAKQKQRMSQRLNDFADDFDALADDEKLNEKSAEREAA